MSDSFHSEGRPRGSRGSDRSKRPSAVRAGFLVSVLVTILLAILCWFFQYYATVNKLSDLLIQLSGGLFGLFAVGVLGQILYEFSLRQRILDETKTTLAEVLLEEGTLAELIPEDRRHRIIESFVGLQAGDEEYGRALSQLVSLYLGMSGKKRRNFSEHITFTMPSALPAGNVLNDYYQATEHLTFRGVLPTGEIRIGCARTAEELERMFRDDRSIFRWATFCDRDAFLSLMRLGIFKASITANGIACPEVSKDGGNQPHSGDGWELTYALPRSLHGREVDVVIDVDLLHPRAEKSLTVHLVYPAASASVHFSFGETPIHRVNVIRFVRPNVKAETTVIRGPGGRETQAVAEVKATGSDWLFPDEGFAFMWEDSGA